MIAKCRDHATGPGEVLVRVRVCRTVRAAARGLPHAPRIRCPWPRRKLTAAVPSRIPLRGDGRLASGEFGWGEDRGRTDRIPGRDVRAVRSRAPRPERHALDRGRDPGSARARFPSPGFHRGRGLPARDGRSRSPRFRDGRSRSLPGPWNARMYRSTTRRRPPFPRSRDGTMRVRSPPAELVPRRGREGRKARVAWTRRLRIRALPRIGGWPRSDLSGLGAKGRGVRAPAPVPARDLDTSRPPGKNPARKVDRGGSRRSSGEGAGLLVREFVRGRVHGPDRDRRPGSESRRP